jgi:hypothetical protein
MRQLALAVILACMLTGTAWAGEIPSGDRTPPPPPPPCTLTTTGEVPTSDATAPGTVITIILTLITIGR